MSDITPSMSSVPGAGPKLGGNKGIIIAVVIVVILAAAAYLIFSAGSKPKQQPSGPAEQSTQTSAPEVATPNEVYSYVGEITAVNNGQITVAAKKEMNLLEADANLTVMINPDTQVIRRIIPRVLPESGGGDLFKQENITASDLKVGDQVTVVSATNVRGITNFTASRVEVIVVR